MLLSFGIYNDKKICHRFPRSGTEDSFDDAYLSGEIVHILMKYEKFDDARLCEHMVAYGRAMGIGKAEVDELPLCI